MGYESCWTTQDCTSPSSKNWIEGVLVRDAHDQQPYYVRAAGGKRWWYYQYEVTPCNRVGVERESVSHLGDHSANRGSHVGPHTIVHHQRPRVGSKVCLTKHWKGGGPLKPGEEGVLVRDAHDRQPYYVQAAGGGKWWYFPNEITPCNRPRHVSHLENHNASHVQPHSIVHHHRLRVGSKVCLTSYWRKGGPLKRGEEGVLVKDTHDYQPYLVQAPNGKNWWYFSNEIKSCGK